MKVAKVRIEGFRSLCRYCHHVFEALTYNEVLVQKTLHEHTHKGGIFFKAEGGS